MLLFCIIACTHGTQILIVDFLPPLPLMLLTLRIPVLRSARIKITITVSGALVVVVAQFIGYFYAHLVRALTHLYIYSESERYAYIDACAEFTAKFFFPSYIFVLLIFRFIFISFPFICYCPSRYLLLYALHCSCSLAHSLTHAHSIGFSAAFS